MPDQATPEIQDLIKRLLVRRPCERIGSVSVNELKSHPVFHNVNFDQIYCGKQAPLKPRQMKLSLQKKQESGFLPDREIWDCQIPDLSYENETTIDDTDMS